MRLRSQDVHRRRRRMLGEFLESRLTMDGDPTTWLAPVDGAIDGNFSDATRWDKFPASVEYANNPFAVFSADETYTVHLDHDSFSNVGQSVTAGNVTLDIPKTYNIAGPQSVSTGTLTVLGEGKLLGTGILAIDEGGVMTVGDSTTYAATDAIIGNGSDGTLNIDSHATANIFSNEIDSYVRVGYFLNDPYAADVEAHLNVSNAKLSAKDLIVGDSGYVVDPDDPDSVAGSYGVASGNVVIDGSEAVLNVGGGTYLGLGRRTNGKLVVSGGARANLEGDANLGGGLDDNPSYGELDIAGARSTVTTMNVWVGAGDKGKGNLYVGQGGYLYVGDRTDDKEAFLDVASGIQSTGEAEISGLLEGESIGVASGDNSIGVLDVHGELDAESLSAGSSGTAGSNATIGLDGVMNLRQGLYLGQGGAPSNVSMLVQDGTLSTGEVRIGAGGEGGSYSIVIDGTGAATVVASSDMDVKANGTATLKRGVITTPG